MPGGVGAGGTKTPVPTPKTPGKTAHSEKSAAPGAAVGDRDLALIALRWPDLPAYVRAAIVTLASGADPK